MSVLLLLLIQAQAVRGAIDEPPTAATRIPIDCFIFSSGGKACFDCVNVNHCGTCDLGNPITCDAVTAQFCNTKKIAATVSDRGRQRVIIEVHCFYQVLCVPPDCALGTEECGVGTQPVSFSAETSFSEEPAGPCPQ